MNDEFESGALDEGGVFSGNLMMALSPLLAARCFRVNRLKSLPRTAPCAR